MSHHNRRMLLDIFQCLQQQPVALPDSYRAWLGSGIEKYFMTGNTLDQCLGLPSPGLPKLATELRRAERNLAIQRSFESLGGVLSQPHSAQPEILFALQDAVLRFNRSKWRLWRDRTTPPENASPTERHLHLAFCRADPGRQYSNGIPIPSSTKQLSRIIWPDKNHPVSLSTESTENGKHEDDNTHHRHHTSQRSESGIDSV